MPYLLFRKSGKILDCRLLQIIGGTLWVNSKQVEKCIRMGIAIFKIFIWRGISSDIRSEITFKAPHMHHSKTCFKRPLKNRQINGLKDSLMKVESIAQGEHSAILLTCIKR